MTIINKSTSNVGKNVAERDPSCAVGGNADWCSHCRKHYGGSSKILKRNSSYDPAIPLPGTYLKKPKTLTQKNGCTPCILEHNCILECNCILIICSLLSQKFASPGIKSLCLHALAVLLSPTSLNLLHLCLGPNLSKPRLAPLQSLLPVPLPPRCLTTFLKWKCSFHNSTCKSELTIQRRILRMVPKPFGPHFPSPLSPSLPVLTFTIYVLATSNALLLLKCALSGLLHIYTSSFCLDPPLIYPGKLYSPCRTQFKYHVFLRLP